MLRLRFDAMAARTPTACALIDGGERISYAELTARANRLAFVLERAAGVQFGACVAVSLPNCWEVAAGFLATAGLGAAWAPFHPEWRSREVCAYAYALAPRVLITRRDLLPPWTDGACLPPTVILVDDAEVQETLRTSENRLPPLPRAAAAPCVYLPTSGSTGRPRTALRSIGQVMAAVQSSADVLGLHAAMRQICVMPFHHSGGFNTCLLLPLLSGMTSVVQASFNTTAFATAVAEEKVQVLMGSPFVYAMLLESGVPRAAFDSVEMAFSFGAPITPSVVRRCADELGLSVRQHYGAAETGVIAIQSAATPFVPGLVGHPVPSAQVRVVGDHDEQLPSGRIGAIEVRGPAVITRYHDRQPGDEEIFRDGWFRGGDLGYIDPAGALILRGRSKTMINVSGIKIDPVEIEHVVKELPAVFDCMVRGVRDDRQVEMVEAMLVLRKGQALTRQALIAHCRKRLAEYKLPRRITFCESLPVDTTGKRKTLNSVDPPKNS
jgi:acyl-CoA synthetase (AMP-forming)/AMP-acid ligase II